MYIETDKIYDYLVENQIATENEISLVTSINGYNEESLNAILFSRIGYRCLSQLEEMEEF
tara:strand:+ start:873 stop:1052 length:180 start_codon:yes stop_codon:yes gene_type:complete